MRSARNACRVCCVHRLPRKSGRDAEQGECDEQEVDRGAGGRGAIAAAAFAASSVLGAGSGGSPRPAYATVSVDLSHATPATARRAAPAAKGNATKKQAEEAQGRLPPEPVPGEETVPDTSQSDAGTDTASKSPSMGRVHVGPSHASRARKELTFRSTSPTLLQPPVQPGIRFLLHRPVETVRHVKELSPEPLRAAQVQIHVTQQLHRLHHSRPRKQLVGGALEHQERALGAAKDATSG